ncbi:hypothetical protein CONPUDRAFT_164211 [Coniophora puteana RWD-64-598 SS2]|uniref:Histone chaperone domain-containing protein n=1 Tax=Coniophora puteana (strain RWD-64-598) TaxID=741705 RepID=A0A5M3MX75_CONPW|nr:uncharacterized protein CONPUDRAFT_164211 [Coniophora puteana RWD-64-598 SS2]EIW83231.1 hypothetical protein CONPUDRAFT_164211 [Coniophora puteana RWD-64-598 SS2]
MSNAAGDPTATGNTSVTNSPDKGKGKSKEPASADVSMEVEEEEEEEEDDDEEEEEEEEEEEDDTSELDPSAILPQGRRTRGVRVDYTSTAALEKAGLKAGDDDEDEDEEMK